MDFFTFVLQNHTVFFSPSLVLKHMLLEFKKGLYAYGVFCLLKTLHVSAILTV